MDINNTLGFVAYGMIYAFAGIYADSLNSKSSSIGVMVFKYNMPVYLAGVYFYFVVLF